MRLVLGTVLVSVLACGPDVRPARPDTSADQSRVLPSMTWINPASDFPAMRLHFDPNGTARFEGGFVFFNPVRWRYDSTARELYLRLSGIDSSTIATFEDGIARGHAIRFDRSDSALVTRVDRNTRSIWIAGFTFFLDSISP